MTVDLTLEKWLRVVDYLGDAAAHCEEYGHDAGAVECEELARAIKSQTASTIQTEGEQHDPR